MKLYVTVFVTLLLTGCGTKPNDYFICKGYESTTTDYFGEKESLVINQTNKSITFKSIHTNYEEPRPNYIYSQYKLTEESAETYLLKFDIVTGELILTIGNRHSRLGGIGGKKEFKYLCFKVEKLIK